MDWKSSMYLKYRKNYYSQNGEDGIIEKIIDQLNLTEKLYVCEFGAWDGKFLSNTFNLVDKKNAIALMIESDKNKFEDLLQTTKDYPSIIPVNNYVTPIGDNSLDVLLEKNNFPINFDLLSIDVDSNDLDIWEGMKKYKPKIVVIEINSVLSPWIKQRHDLKLGLFGNSFRSTLEVAKEKDYSPVVHTGNLIMLQNELINKINFDKILIENPEKMFIYDWIKKRKIRDSIPLKILRFLIPKSLRNKFNNKLKENFLKFFS